MASTNTQAKNLIDEMPEPAADEGIAIATALLDSFDGDEGVVVAKPWEVEIRQRYSELRVLQQENIGS